MVCWIVLGLPSGSSLFLKKSTDIFNFLSLPIASSVWGKWRVYFKAVYKIDSIYIYNREDCCSDRLSNFKVNVLRGESIVWSYTHSGMPGYHAAIDVPGTVNGDSVEVEVSLPGNNTSEDSGEEL